MRSLHLSLLTFFNVLTVSILLYSSTVSASPVVPEIKSQLSELQKAAAIQSVAESKPTEVKETIPSVKHHEIVQHNPGAKVVEKEHAFPAEIDRKVQVLPPVPEINPPVVAKSLNAHDYTKSIVTGESKKADFEARSAVVEESKPVASLPDQVKDHGAHVQKSHSVEGVSGKNVPKELGLIYSSTLNFRPDDISSAKLLSIEKTHYDVERKSAPEAQVEHKVPVKQIEPDRKEPVKEVTKKVDMIAQPDPTPSVSHEVVPVVLVVPPVHVAPVAPSVAPVQVQATNPEQNKGPLQPVETPVTRLDPSVVVQSHKLPSQVSAPLVVKGGLGPLHLLAATLCSYQPERPSADESLNLLYSQRAAARKSLFDFMSLKFTNLEKLSSRLNAGLEVVPRKTTDSSQPSDSPSHGWPVVGKCTAHDLRLMAEAAWCECAEGANCDPAKPSNSTEVLDKQVPEIVSNHHRANAARSMDSSAHVPSSIITKILHVSSVKDSPIVESSIASLNLTQQQLATLQTQGITTRECRRNALRLTKALFNHLAEDQKNTSDSWPKLYTQMAEDECARKRMIDIVSALSGFRSESTTIRRDNVEFAFAMDDLRSKVLESEVNTPLTFDKQFIEVEQFLQQSVKLMMANIDPERAKLTSMRYRSFMPGPVSADDQCIELHQRLLAKNYPTDCNPTQFGQLPDVLRMTASSLELWSIESELSKHSHKIQEYPPSSCSHHVKVDVNECISNLVAS